MSDETTAVQDRIFRAVIDTIIAEGWQRYPNREATAYEVSYEAVQRIEDTLFDWPYHTNGARGFALQKVRFVSIHAARRRWNCAAPRTA